MRKFQCIYCTNISLVLLCQIAYTLNRVTFLVQKYHDIGVFNPIERLRPWVNCLILDLFKMKLIYNLIETLKTNFCAKINKKPTLQCITRYSY